MLAGGGVGFAGLLPGAGGAGFPAGGGGGVLPAGGGGGVFPAGGGGGVFPAGGGGVFPAGGGGVFPAGGGVFPAGGGVFPAGGGVFPAGEGAFPAGDVLGFAGDLASVFPAAGLAALGSALGSTVLACPGWGGTGVPEGFILTLLGFPKSSSVLSGKIWVTIPAAMVFPPSLSANLDPLSMVMGKFSLAFIVRLSPGFAILTPSGRQISAAVSAVLK